MAGQFREGGRVGAEVESVWPLWGREALSPLYGRLRGMLGYSPFSHRLVLTITVLTAFTLVKNCSMQCIELCRASLGLRDQIGRHATLLISLRPLLSTTFFFPQKGPAVTALAQQYHTPRGLPRAGRVFAVAAIPQNYAF